MGTVTNFEKSIVKTDERELLDNYRMLDKRGKHEVQLAAYLQFERVCNEYFASQREMQQADGTEPGSNIVNLMEVRP